jgi:transcriptional regulator with XRE-family HTH domain
MHVVLLLRIRLEGLSAPANARALQIGTLIYHSGKPHPGRHATSRTSQILTGYASLARSLGLSPERLAKLVDLDLSTLNDLDSRISASAFAELLERLAEAAKAEDFGLRLAESRDLGILGPIGIVIHQEPDLRSALCSLIRYLPVHNESLALRLEEERGIAVLSLDVRSSGHETVRQVTELSLGAFFRILSRLAGPHWKPHRVCFEHKAPRHVATHRSFFRCRVEFEQDRNAIVFPAVDLDAPLAMSDAMLARYAHRYLDSIIEHRAASAGEKVRELIRVSISSGRCSTDKIARGLGVDRRTVHRYLARRENPFPRFQLKCGRRWLRDCFRARDPSATSRTWSDFPGRRPSPGGSRKRLGAVRRHGAMRMTRVDLTLPGASAHRMRLPRNS